MAAATPFTAADCHYMAAAIAQARMGWYSCRPNPRVGCVLVNDGRIVGEGAHLRAGAEHAERIALRVAGAAARGASCYVTLEPCCHQGKTPPCTEALIAAGVARVFYATPDPNPMVCGRGAAQLENAGIAVAAGLLADAAGQLNPGFLRRMQSGRPFVRAKIAMSLDAKVAAVAGASRWITSPEARADVQRLRAEAGAILTGVGTVIADDPALTVRDPRFDPPGQPIRAIVDTRLRLPPRARLLSLPGRTVVFCAAPDAAARAALRAAGADVHVVAADAGRVDLGAVLESLGESQVNEVLVEAGPVLTSQMLLRRLIDELIVYLAPRLIGEGGRHAFPVSGDDALRATAGLKVIDTRRVGPDWRLTALIN